MKSCWYLEENSAFIERNFTILPSEKFKPPLHPIKGCRPTHTIRTYDENFPDAFDWRDKGVIGDVINQLYCNACWTISILGVMESMVAIDEMARGKFDGVTRLSVQELIDCSYRNGCSVGDPRTALEDMMERNMSVVKEEEYPLTLKEEQCKIPDFNRVGVMVKDFSVQCKLSAEEMMALIYHHGPVVVTVNSSPWLFYTDGVITWNCPSYFHLSRNTYYSREICENIRQ
ncbi:cathepsin O-like [Amyelois transitella]|uniref:cathepsin O-like n=1 Tax=Amyelois transitella TaxID=680683 RepID=UPI0029906A9A|nr:cathepsin O-like [Amyelois transitella]